MLYKQVILLVFLAIIAAATNVIALLVFLSIYAGIMILLFVIFGCKTDHKGTDTRLRLPIATIESCFLALIAVSISVTICYISAQELNITSGSASAILGFIGVLLACTSCVYLFSPLLVQINWVPRLVVASQSEIEQNVHAARYQDRIQVDTQAAAHALRKVCYTSCLRIPECWSSVHDAISINAILLLQDEHSDEMGKLHEKLDFASPMVSSTKSTYDFATTGLALALNASQPLLSDHCCDKIAFELIPHSAKPASGSALGVYVPGLLGAVFDTENHMLNHAVSTYLRNQFLYHRDAFQAGAGDNRFNNVSNGCELFLTRVLMAIIREESTHEFSAIPYEGYSFQPLIALASAALSETIRWLATRCLDLLLRNACVASMSSKQCAPCRRNVNQHSSTGLHSHRLLAALNLWSTTPTDHRALGDGPHHKYAAICQLHFKENSYLPPSSLVTWFNDPDSRHAFQFQLEHTQACTQRFTGDSLHTLSSGGVASSFASRVLLRPTLLLLRDDAHDITQCFRIIGKRGKYGSFANGAHGFYGQFDGWDLSGVSNSFAIAYGRALPPDDGPECIVSDCGWHVYLVPSSFTDIAVAIFNQDGIAALAVDGDTHSVQGCIHLVTHLSAQPLGKKRHATFMHRTGESAVFSLAHRGNVIREQEYPQAQSISLLNS